MAGTLVKLAPVLLVFSGGAVFGARRLLARVLDGTQYAYVAGDLSA
ncbi:hypothetical protein ACFVMC_32155 [Nocardia sp. NPDC127579]